MSRELIEQYRQGARKLMESAQGLSADQLRWTPPADANIGRWSIQQIVLHLVDADLVIADRMKRVIAEENPQLLAFDENKWTESLQYDQQETLEACLLFELNRKMIARTLGALPENAFSRSGMHSEAGRKTLTDLIAGANRHLEHHLKFIQQKRAALGK